MTKTKKENTVAAANPTGLIAPYDYGDDAGKGMDVSQGERSLPFLKILQAQSPEVAGPKGKVPGAEAGMFYNTATGELFKTITIVPAIRQHKIVEWRPRNEGGGIVSSTDVNDGIYPEYYSAAVAKCEADGRKFGDFWTGVPKKSNQLKETFYVFAVVLNNGESEGSVVVPFQSTAIQSYKKQFMRRILAVKGNPPMYAFSVVLSTVSQTNDEGTWFNYEIAFPIDDNTVESMLAPDSAAFIAGRSMNELVGVGTVTADEATASNDDAGGNAGKEKAF